MMRYRLKESISATRAQVMYWYGEKEMKCVKRSARLFQEKVPSCRIYEAKGCGHGYLAVYLPEEWMKVAVPFLEEGRGGRRRSELFTNNPHHLLTWAENPCIMEEAKRGRELRLRRNAAPADR